MTVRSIRIRRRVKWLPTVMGALAASMALTPAAQAASSPLTIASCTDPTTQAFSAWDDLNDYALVPGGDFEGDLTGWTLTGATKADGSEPSGVTGSVGAGSLLISDGGEADSAATCIDATRETMRLFTRSDSPDARLRIDAVYLKRGETVKTTKVGTINSQSDWQPSLVLDNPVDKVLKNVLGDSPTVAYRFTAKRGAVQIDDVLIDPRMNR